MQTTNINPRELITRPPFSTLFPIDRQVLCAIQEDMQAVGYDDSKPLNVWNGIVIDGHTRLTSALAVNLTSVPVFEHDFADEQKALEYAIHNQRNRRNLTDADILRCVAALDERKPERGGGDRRSEEAQSKAQDCAFEGKSAEATAQVVGISPRKVEQVRTVLDHATPDIKLAVEVGAKSINTAYNETQERRAKARADFNETIEAAQSTPELQASLTVKVAAGVVQMWQDMMKSGNYASPRETMEQLVRLAHILGDSTTLAHASEALNV